MKNCWTFLLFAVILQSIILTVLGGHHGHGSGLAHILAAGLIVQLLASRNNHHGHHHHEGRQADGDIHSEHSPYGYSQDPWVEEHRAMTPQATLSSSSWAQRAPMAIGYSHAQYREPVMESYNIPYYYQPHGAWGM